MVRRGAEALVIARVSQDSENREALGHLARLIAASLDDETCDRMANSLADEYPWIEFLPVDQRREFVGNYFRLLRASAKLGTFGRVTELLNSWEGTAEAYALGLEPVAIDRNFLASDEALVPAPRIMAKKDMEVLRPAKNHGIHAEVWLHCCQQGVGQLQGHCKQCIGRCMGSPRTTS